MPVCWRLRRLARSSMSYWTAPCLWAQMRRRTWGTSARYSDDGRPRHALVRKPAERHRGAVRGRFHRRVKSASGSSPAVIGPETARQRAPGGPSPCRNGLTPSVNRSRPNRATHARCVEEVSPASASDQSPRWTHWDESRLETRARGRPRLHCPQERAGVSRAMSAPRGSKGPP